MLENVNVNVCGSFMWMFPAELCECVVDILANVRQFQCMCSNLFFVQIEQYRYSQYNLLQEYFLRLFETNGDMVYRLRGWFEIVGQKRLSATFSALFTNVLQKPYPVSWWQIATMLKWTPATISTRNHIPLLVACASCLATTLPYSWPPGAMGATQEMDMHQDPVAFQHTWQPIQHLATPSFLGYLDKMWMSDDIKM